VTPDPSKALHGAAKNKGFQKRKLRETTVGSLKERIRSQVREKLDIANLTSSTGLSVLHQTTINRVLKCAENLGYNHNERKGWWTKSGHRLLIKAAEQVFNGMCRDVPDSPNIDPLGRWISRARKAMGMPSPCPVGTGAVLL